MNMKIYWDNAATLAVGSVPEKMMPPMASLCGNPWSLYTNGRNVRWATFAAREKPACHPRAMPIATSPPFQLIILEATFSSSTI